MVTLPVNLLHIFRTPFYKKTSGVLLPNLQYNVSGAAVLEIAINFTLIPPWLAEFISFPCWICQKTLRFTNGEARDKVK